MLILNTSPYPDVATQFNKCPFELQHPCLQEPVQTAMMYMYMSNTCVTISVILDIGSYALYE
jgi:hypothetical protein